MNAERQEKRSGECECHDSPPCNWCMCLDEGEVDAYANGGRPALEEYWDSLDATELAESTLIDAGWRIGEPERTIRSAWVGQGGAWQAVISITNDGDALTERFDAVRGHHTILWSRPVHGLTWDYAPEGWGTKTIQQTDDPVGFQSAPTRYLAKGRETIDRIRDELGDDGFVAFCIGNAMKYEDRDGLKGDEHGDRLKARWYRAMASHVTSGTPDPRSGRPDFQEYLRPQLEPPGSAVCPCAILPPGKTATQVLVPGSERENVS